MSDREELAALRRMAELEAKAGGTATKDQPRLRATTEGATYEMLANAAGSPVDIVNFGMNALTAPTRMAPSVFGSGIPKVNTPVLGSEWWKERLGVKDQISKAAYNAGGEATDVATRLGASPETAAKVGFATNLSAQTIPVLLGGEIGKLASPIFDSASRTAMTSAVKPSVDDHLSGNAGRAIDTMLKEGINVSQGGVHKLRQKIGDLNQEVARNIASSNARVDKGDIYRQYASARDTFMKQVNQQKDLNTLRESFQEFMAHPFWNPAGKMPVQKAQELKQGTYRMLEGKYGELESAGIEAQKAMARGLKEGISSAVPAVASLNAKESELINALSVMERRAFLELNKNPGGLAYFASNPKAAAAYMADKSSMFKSMLARALYSGQEAIPGSAGMAVGAGFGALSGSNRQ